MQNGDASQWPQWLAHQGFAKPNNYNVFRTVKDHFEEPKLHVPRGLPENMQRAIEAAGRNGEIHVSRNAAVLSYQGGGMIVPTGNMPFVLPQLAVQHRGSSHKKHARVREERRSKSVEPGRSLSGEDKGSAGGSMHGDDGGGVRPGGSVQSKSRSGARSTGMERRDAGDPDEHNPHFDDGGSREGGHIRAAAAASKSESASGSRSGGVVDVVGGGATPVAPLAAKILDGAGASRQLCFKTPEKGVRSHVLPSMSPVKGHVVLQPDYGAAERARSKSTEPFMMSMRGMMAVGGALGGGDGGGVSDRLVDRGGVVEQQKQQKQQKQKFRWAAPAGGARQEEQSQRSKQKGVVAVVDGKAMTTRDGYYMSAAHALIRESQVFMQEASNEFWLLPGERAISLSSLESFLEVDRATLLHRLRNTPKKLMRVVNTAGGRRRRRRKKSLPMGAEGMVYEMNSGEHGWGEEDGGSSSEEEWGGGGEGRARGGEIAGPGRVLERSETQALLVREARKQELAVLLGEQVTTSELANLLEGLKRSNKDMEMEANEWIRAKHADKFRRRGSVLGSVMEDPNRPDWGKVKRETKEALATGVTGAYLNRQPSIKIERGQTFKLDKGRSKRRLSVVKPEAHDVLTGWPHEATSPLAVSPLAARGPLLDVGSLLTPQAVDDGDVSRTSDGGEGERDEGTN